MSVDRFGISAARFNMLVDSAINIPRKILANEAELLVFKWPAYSFMSPWHLTMKFKDEYRRVYKAFYRSHIDLHQSEHVVGLNMDKLMSVPGELTKLWVARQDADRLGMPYDKYIWFAFKFAFDRQRKQAPRPNQLRASAKSSKAWKAKFLADQQSAGGPLTPTPIPQFHLDHDQGLPAQNAFRQRRLASIACNRRTQLNVMREDVAELQLLEMRHLEPYWRPSTFIENKAQVEEEVRCGLIKPSPASALKPEELRQSCFALPGRPRDQQGLSQMPTYPVMLGCRGGRPVGSAQPGWLPGPNRPAQEKSQQGARQEKPSAQTRRADLAGESEIAGTGLMYLDSYELSPLALAGMVSR